MQMTKVKKKNCRFIKHIANTINIENIESKGRYLSLEHFNRKIIKTKLHLSIYLSMKCMNC